MPASVHPDPGAPPDDAGDAAGEGPSLDALLDRLADGVERIARAYEGTRERLAALEEERRALREAMTTSGGEKAAPDVEERLARLATENRRLRETLEEARVRAERIRSRLQVVEDEV